MIINEASLEKFMSASDWAIIFDDSGCVRGLFIPSGHEEEEVPERILNVLKAAGIDISEEFNLETIH